MRYVLIIIFAAAMVALGGRELHRKYIDPAQASGHARPQILKDLVGETPLERAQFDSRRYERLERERRDRLELEQIDDDDALHLEKLIDGFGSDGEK